MITLSPRETLRINKVQGTENFTDKLDKAPQSNHFRIVYTRRM
jgi:hypothetical protein